ncbi:probable basic-leucine zipper transcription factor J [Contarinia nasturtii]|uniref:probable basic-leucine zipper transcription factor J n=1 Tax=Contarinia nasturtii TaxID=265458 RepID=UPI0012D3C8F5|nr:probable basic-leucine zipper transcription factor J [Contarinia nasturtii]
MDFAMKDFDLHTATGDSAVNVQHKKPFDIADVDNNAMKIENEEWNIDSIFPLNTDFLNDFNDLGDLNMDTWTDAYDYMSSPTSTGTESENDHDMLGMKPIADQMLSPPQNLISSSSSDSGLSSDHVDFDMNFDQIGSDLLQQPLLSSQIIPELADEELQLTKLVKPEAVLEKSIKISPSNTPKFIKQNATPIQLKTKPTEQTVSTQNVQNIKRAPTNVVQMSDVKPVFKQQNGAIISENVVANNTSIVINKINGNISGIRKLVQVKKGPNQKSIILPFSLKNGTDIRSIKIIKPSSLTKSPKILMAASNLLQEYKQNAIIVNKPIKLEPKYEIDSMSEPSDCESYKFEEMFVHDDDDDDDVNNDSEQDGETEHQSEYPKLVLSGEEKRLLAKEGITLPAHYPLTKHEERELKRIRRKIRNKISAQDSRKRKKEYVDGLEERVKKCTDDNQTLQKRIKLLQTQNQNLVNQMKKMQSLLSKCGNKSVQPATCLMVLLMSMALIAAPNLKMNKDGNDGAMPTDIMMEENQMQQNRRSLLFDSREKFGDAVADEEMGNDFGLFCKTEDNEHNYATDASCNQFNKVGDLIDTLDLDDDDPWVPPNRTSHQKIPAEHFDNTYDSSVVMKDIVMNVSPVTHIKTAKNLSDLPPENAYQLKIDANGIPNIVNLNTEIDSKNV